MKPISLITFTFFVTLAYTQPRVVRVDSDQLEQTTFQESNAIKIHLLEFISKDFSFYYERALFGKVSAEIGLGLTYGDDFGNLFSTTKNGPIIVDNKLGYSFALGLRFYPSEIFDQFYIAPEFKFRKYNWNREFNNFYQYPEADGIKADESRVHLTPRLTLGYLLYLTEVLYLDFHFGIGLNTPTETLYNLDNSRIEKHTLKPRPKVNGGIKIGYIF